MDDMVPSPPASQSKKRPAEQEDSPRKRPLNIKGDQFMLQTPPDTDQSSNVSPDVSINNDLDDRERAVSPAPSSSALSSTAEIMSSNIAESSATTAPTSTGPTSTNGPPPAKRRKLTPSEKLEKQRLREVKERERAEEKTRKEEEKRVKDEEKAKKEEERREEKRVKDEEKRQKAEEKEAKKREKELEEERKNQEKLSKERKQMRLGAFFQQKPVTPGQQSDVDEYQARARRRSLSLETYDSVAEQIKRAASPAKRGTPPPMSAKKPNPTPSEVSDYHRAFLQFELPMHTTIANIAQEHSEAAQDAFDRELKQPSLEEQYDLGMISSYQGHAEIGHYFENGRNTERGLDFPKVRDLIDTINGTLQHPIDLVGDRYSKALESLRQAPIKHIHFNEDVRPAYCGTYTKLKSPNTIRKIRRNPFTRARQDTNYDYDSEAEWEPPEEGDEEVLSDEEDEIDSQADANDMDFLDDAEDTGKKRKLITGELEPQSTGLCWADESGRVSVAESIEGSAPPNAMHGMQMGVLLPGFSGRTIDPFCTTYWQESNETSSATTFGLFGVERSTGTMAPPRPPLQPRISGNGSPLNDLVGAAQGQKGPITSTQAVLQSAKRGPKPTPKTLNKEDLEEFKEAVVGSPLGKLELQKGLKTRFPKLTNECIKETLSSQFAQVGKGKGDKHWVFISQA